MRRKALTLNARASSPRSNAWDTIAYSDGQAI